MGRIAEIIESGHAPGFAGLHQDPTSADVAVPRAIKEVFDIGYRHQKGKRPIRDEEVFKSIGYDKNTLKQTWKNL